jgi:hypothetical protein|tara:strand:- start:389 stop:559 length:171 start_codon:yes stop_codon:yes gene_type:complete
MSKIIKLGFMGTILYFGINWAADHPLKMKVLRKRMNQQVEEGYKAAVSHYEAYTKE